MVLYSPVTSLNGAKLLLNKGPPRKVTVEDMSDAVTAPTILTPHALPTFRDLDPGRGTKRRRDKERMDPRKSRRPELPVTGPGKGGRVGASATQHIVQNLVRDTTRDVDVSTSFSVPMADMFPTLYRYRDGNTDRPFFSPERRCSSTQTLQTKIHNGLEVRSPFFASLKQLATRAETIFYLHMFMVY